MMINQLLLDRVSVLCLLTILGYLNPDPLIPSSSLPPKPDLDYSLLERFMYVCMYINHSRLAGL